MARGRRDVESRAPPPRSFQARRHRPRAARSSPLKSRGCTSGCGHRRRRARRAATCSRSAPAPAPRCPPSARAPALPSAPMAAPSVDAGAQARGHQRRSRPRRPRQQRTRRFVQAIISGEGQLFIVKEGEAVTARYRVARISAEVVELIDVSATTSTRRLARSRNAPCPSQSSSIRFSGGGRGGSVAARAQLAVEAVERHGDRAEVFVTERLRSRARARASPRPAAARASSSHGAAMARSTKSRPRWRSTTCRSASIPSGSGNGLAHRTRSIDRRPAAGDRRRRWRRQPRADRPRRDRRSSLRQRRRRRLRRLRRGAVQRTRQRRPRLCMNYARVAGRALCHLRAARTTTSISVAAGSSTARC